MDHRISKDMISSGMIPSGEKTQADLSRTQYGSAPSPSKLMDAYKSMYDKKEEVINEHHKKDADGNTIPHEGEELNEGKIPAGLQAYLDKKKGKKEDKKEMKEGAGLYANIHAKRKRGGKMRKKGDAGAPSSQDFANAAKTAKEEVDKFDVVFNHFISEGYSEKEAYTKMVNLTEEELDEMLGAITRATKSLATRASQYGANLGKPASQKINVVNPSRKPFDAKTKPFDAKKPEPKPGDSGFKAKSASDVVSAAAAMRKKRMEKEMEPKKGQVMQDNADLFDIVKGQLLDEGLSEEEIRDIMLTLTPDEIMKEMNQGPSTPVKNYGDSPDKPKILPNFGATRAKPRTTDKGTLIKGGKDTGKTPAQMSQEEYKGSGTPEQQAAMKAQVEVSKKVNRYGGKTPSGTTAVDAKKGIEDVRKSM